MPLRARSARPADVDAVLRAHATAGRGFAVGDVRSFVRDEGAGPPVVLMHGLPASSFLYRKILGPLAAAGLRPVAFDLPGLGLADRPERFDYSVRGLGRFSALAVDALGLERFHLVVHDAGGPVGFELAELLRERVASLTILNTIVVRRPSVPFPGEVLARFVKTVPRWAQSRALWRQMMFAVGILDASATPAPEVDAYRELAVGRDGGSGYLRIMRALGDPARGPRDYSHIVDARTSPYPVQIIWGARDPILTLRRFGLPALAATGLPEIHALPARHYLQEDQAPAIVDLIVRLAARDPSLPPASGTAPVRVAPSG